VASDIRPSPIAGTWYDGNPKILAGKVDAYLRNAILPELEGRVVAVISPHAGHQYSGTTAGYAFATVKDQAPDLVAVVSPMHHPYPQRLLTTGHDAYSTPLGEIEVERNAVEEINKLLLDSLGFGLTPIQFDPEHSLEIVLPFLQQALKKDFHLIPIMLRDQTPTISEAVGHALARVLGGQNALLVASSDLSHFYDEDEARSFDDEMLKQIAEFSPQGVFKVEMEGKGFACGVGAIAAVMWAAKDLGANQVKVLHHSTSGEVTDDYQRVVGYGAAAILKTA